MLMQQLDDGLKKQVSNQDGNYNTLHNSLTKTIQEIHRVLKT